MDQDLAAHAILVVVVILYKHVFVSRACSRQCSSILMMNSDSERSHVTCCISHISAGMAEPTL